MKKLIALTALLTLLAGSLAAQTNTSTLGNLGDWWGVVTNSGLLNASNYSAHAYATYAPKLSKKWGGGVLVGYNFNENVGFALGADYLGQFSLVSANVTLQAPIRPFNFMANSFGSNFVVAPFALVGAGVPLSGTGGANGVLITDVGAYVEYGHLWGGKFNAGVAWGQWANAGLYTGERYHVFVGWGHRFR